MLHHLVSVAVLLSAGLITAQAENVNDFESLALVRRYKAASRAQSLVRRAPSPCSTDTTNTEVWEPEVGTEWQIVLQSNLKATNKFTPDVPVYDIDLFGNDDSVFKALKEQGKKIICYFSAGSYEPYRPDSDDFKASDKGSIMDGWEDENWLDINSDNVRAIMKKRIELAADRGCDAIDPDNMDGYNNKNGVDLTRADSIGYVKYLASVAKPLGLSMGLKNAGEIIDDVLDDVQFSVNEQCTAWSECTTFAKFIDAGKPVFQIEYPSEDDLDKSTICGTSGAAKGSDKFSKVIKSMDLDGSVEYCGGSKTYRTTLGSS